MKRSNAAALILIAVSFFPLFAVQAGEFDLLDRTQPEVAHMLRNHFRTLAHEALDRRIEQYKLLKSREQILLRQKVLRKRFSICFNRLDWSSLIIWLSVIQWMISSVDI